MDEPNITPFPGLEMIVTQEAYNDFLMKFKDSQCEMNRSIIDLLGSQRKYFEYEVGALNSQVSYLTRRLAKLEKRLQGTVHETDPEQKDSKNTTVRG